MFANIVLRFFSGIHDAKQSGKSVTHQVMKKHYALNSERADTAASRQQWEATADRLGNVVGELDSQRGAIERDQARLDELAGRFARNSQSFTLEKGSN